MSCTHSWAPHPMLCVALLRQECSLQPPARGKFKASACRQLLPSPKSNYKTVAEGKKLDELFSCVCNAGNFSEMLKLLLLLSLCSETRRRSRNKNGQNILLFRVPSAKTISRRWQTDRQTFLFNIWKNQISGRGEWPQGLRVILPREIQVELHRRRPKVYKIHIGLHVSAKTVQTYP